MSYKGNKIWAIIPARGESKGIPRKNIVKVAGKPLIAYSIQQALESKYLDGVFVSTEDDQIRHIAHHYGASVIERPIDLSRDDSTSLDVLRHAVSHMENVLKIKVEQIICLQATTPTRKTEDIDKAIKLFFDQKADSVVSVIKSPHSFNPYWAKKLVNGQLKVLIKDKSNITRRQELPDTYWHNGQIYITSKENLLEYEDWYSGKCLPYVCDDDSILNIDTPDELEQAEEKIHSLREKNADVITLDFSGRLVGHNHPCFVIAEAGVNHNGDITLALKLVDAAVDSGADAVKFQTYQSENVVTEDAGIAKYQETNSGEKESQLEMIKKFELNFESFKEIKRYCDKKGILFLSTPHSPDAVDFLEELVPLYKIGSGDLTNIPFLENIAEKGKPMILGTGMATLDEIRKSVDIIRNRRNNKIVLLHCTTSYPCPKEDVNLKAMLTIKQKTGCIVGYSDHTTSILTPAIAVALGADVIEKHFTLSKNLPGPDHKASLNPTELKEAISYIRNTEIIFGSKEKLVSENEKSIAEFVRKSVVADKNISKGDVITENMLIIKRPGTGIAPEKIKEIIGKIAKENIKEDTLIDLSKIS